MKYIIIFLFIATLGSIVAGYVIESEYSQKLIGFGVLGLFFVAFPVFAYYRWKDKDIKDYMLTKENLDKMRERREKEK
ncbi:hypothetical protein [Confluentibacter flavum]|uniref:Isoleucyl-tRNA synthetase n=1 Tax=Confluentibacter flavum TaxID=1909700 RepID=A0A2N3HII9_9FLAO|nr:hypothetical protein [Confluentibacter flavum]PKQ44702.1 hypothetical protein CSW08_12010 [Confluentibacter flavum]